jgi:hypothetical protein
MFRPSSEALWQMWAGDNAAAAATLTADDYTPSEVREFLAWNQDYALTGAAPGVKPWLLVGALALVTGYGVFRAVRRT